MKNLKNFLINRKGWIAAAALIAAAAFVQVCNTVPEYCGEGSKLNPETQFCFNGKAYDKCGGAEYNPTNQQCVNGALKTKCAGSETFYNPASEFCFKDTVYAKCGGGIYNPDTQKCTNSAVRTKCGNNYFSQASEFCFKDTVYTKCDGGIYNPDSQTCASGALSTKCGNEYFSQVSEFCFKDTVYPKCGGNIYNPSEQACENGVLLAKCGENNYNPTLQFCYGKQTYPKCGGAGGIEYDPSFQSCEGNILKSKCGNDFFNPASQFCVNDDKIYSLCGGKKYDPATQACDVNIVKTKCGGDIYDSTTAFCLNNTVYQKCRGVVWEPASQKCENEVVKEKCGSGYYDTTIQFCYMNNTYDKCNGKVYDPGVEECKEISMVFVQGGTFTMGCSECSSGNATPAHKVTLNSFYIGRYEISQAQWEEVMGYNPSYTKGYDLPVYNVSWDTVQVFIRKLNTQTGKNYRLPTEAEWEFAARGGIISEGYRYAGSDSIGKVAWYYGNSNSYLQIIGTKQPNELGIYDMSGNLWEWCHDDLRTYNVGSQTNPIGPTNSNYSVVRGGSYQSIYISCRISYRASAAKSEYRVRELYNEYNNYDYRNGVGFRLAHSP